MSEFDAGGTMTNGRTQMLQMQLKAALRDAEEAEKAAELPSLDEARQQLAARLSPLMAERRRALDAQLGEVRAGAQARIDQARAEAAQVIEEAERVAAEAAAQREAERAAAEEAERAAAEELENVAALEAASAALSLDDDHDEESAPAGEPVAEIEQVVEVAALVGLAEAEPNLGAEVIDEPVRGEPVISQPDGIVEVPLHDAPVPPRAPSFDGRDDIWRQVPPAPPRHAPLPVAVAPAPAQVVVDAEAFARVFATVLAEVLGQRGIGPAAAPMVHQDALRPQQQKSSFWSQARHLDVLLLGASALIVMVVLAAWIV